MSSVAQRTIDTIELLAKSPCTVEEVGMHTGVHRTSALRLLRVLSDARLTRRQPDGTYSLGFRLLGLAEMARDQFNLIEVARPQLVEFAALSNQTVHLAALEGDSIIYVDKLEAINTVQMNSQIGQAVCLHTAAVSKAILAFLPRARLNALLDGHVFEQYNENTLASRDALERELKEVHSQLWASDKGEYEDYVHCLAVPIWGPSGGPVAAMSVTSLRNRVDIEGLKEDLLPALLASSEEISKNLGWKK